MKTPFSSFVGALLAPACIALSASPSSAQVRAYAGANAAPLAAHSAPASVLLESARTNVLYDEPGDGRLWAVGASWKASFGAEGVVYYPRVGASEPRRLPHALSPDSVTIGGDPVVFERVVHALRDADRVELDRGSFIERYDLALGSVEQSFVFTALPRAGELVLRIPVASELDAVETSAGLEFRSERGQINYSRAVVVDARGRRTNAATSIEDGAITIRVTADVLADAEFPLVVDPILNAVFPEITVQDTLEIDTAFDAAHGVWVVAYETVFSATDHDMVAKSYDVNGAFLSISIIDATNNSWVAPRVADLAFPGKFLVVAGMTALTNSAKTVHGRVLEQNGTILSAGFDLSFSGAMTGDCIRPDVGGDPFAGAGSKWCIVFERVLPGATHADDQHRIAYTVVNADGSISLGPVELAFGPDDSHPSISKSNGTIAWMVAWRSNDALTLGNIIAAQLSFTGALFSGPFTISSGLSDDALPCASSPLTGTQITAVAWQRGASSHDIVVALIDGSTVLQSVNLMTLEGSPTSAQDQIQPSIDSDGEHFLVSYSEGTGVSNSKLFLTDLAVSANTLVVHQNHLEPQAGFGLSQLRSNVAAARAGGVLDHRYFVVYDTLQNANDHDVGGRFFDGFSGGPATAFCFGTGTTCPCSNGGSSGRGCANSVSGSGALVQMGNFASTLDDTAVLFGQGMPPGSFALFFQGTATATGAAFGDGLLCLGGALTRLAVKPVTVGGGANFPTAGDPALSVAGNVPLFGGGLRTYQMWYRDSASFCTSATFNLSNGLSIQWAR